MEENYRKQWSIEQFSIEYKLELFAFKKLFYKAYSEPPKKWLKKKKLYDSTKIILDTKKSISLIAYELGFSDTSHFIRDFKSAYGYTPKCFRNMKMDLNKI